MKKVVRSKIGMKSNLISNIQNMNIFEVFQRHYASLGISPSDRSTHEWPFNERVLFGLSFFACSILLQLVHVFYVANGFIDHMVSICTASASAAIFVSFAGIVFKQSKLFECIDSIEELIKASESFFN